MTHSGGVTLLFEHSPSQASELEHFESFSRPWENQLAQRFSIKFNLLLFFLIYVGSVSCIYGEI